MSVCVYKFGHVQLMHMCVFIYWGNYLMCCDDRGYTIISMGVLLVRLSENRGSGTLQDGKEMTLHMRLYCHS